MTATKKVTENVVKKEAVKKEVEVDEPTKGDYGIQSVIKFVNGTFKTEFFTDKTVDDVKAEILARDIYWKMILILDIKNDRVIEIVNSDKKTGKKASTDTNVIRVKNMTEAQRKGIIEEYDKVWKVIGEGILEANKTAKAPAMSKEEVINLVLDAFNEHASDEMKELFSKMTPKGRLIIGAKAFTKKSYS